jgi:hypothetical protein
MNPFAGGGGAPPPLRPPGGMARLASDAIMSAPAPTENMSEMPDEAIPPEAVCYHDESEHCGVCGYRTEGQCDWLRMPVPDQGWCKLFKEGGGTSAGGEEEEEVEFEEEGMAEGEPEEVGY